MIEKAHQVWHHAQDVDGKAGEIGKRRIEEHQLASVIKDRESDRQGGECFGQGLNEFAPCGFGVNGVCDLCGIAVKAVLLCQGSDLEPDVRGVSGKVQHNAFDRGLAWLWERQGMLCAAAVEKGCACVVPPCDVARLIEVPDRVGTLHCHAAQGRGLACAKSTLMQFCRVDGARCA